MTETGTKKGWDKIRDLRSGKKPSEIYGIDGATRSLEAEKKINKLLAGIFSGDNGQAALDYLRSITLNNVSGPGIEDHVLRHLEGQRFLVGIIIQRIDRGKLGI
ncbi:MAG: hypothetical protein ABGY96_15335 [bacterium]